MDDWINAGKIAAEALQYGKKLVKVGASVLEVSEKIENKVKELGGECAFPVNISINYVAAHYAALPNDSLEFKENDLVKLDIGVHVNGCIGDAALTVDLGDNKDLVNASKKALSEALKIIKPGLKVYEVGEIIQETIKGFGFSPIKNLSGHSIDKYTIHAGLTIPNYNNNDNSVLEENQIIAIEPFATNGKGKVIEGKNSGIYRLLQKKNVRNMTARKIINDVEKYNGLPFAKRWLKMPMLDFALNSLEREKVLYQYKQLVEISKSLVSQAEHTVIVKDKLIITTSLDS